MPDPDPAEPANDEPALGAIRYGAGTCWPLPPDAELILDEAGAPAEIHDPPELDAHWRRLCAANPRLFDGSISSFDSFDPGTSTIRYRRDSFRRYAVQPEVATGVRVLAITGVLTAPDPASGAERLLIAKRGRDVNTFPGLWEAAPSGTVIAPEPGAALSGASLVEHLAMECREELGFDIEPGAARPLALITDDRAMSADVVFRVELASPAPPDPPADHAWEYEDFAWLTASELARFDTDRAGECIPTLPPICRAIGWTRLP